MIRQLNPRIAPGAVRTIPQRQRRVRYIRDSSVCRLENGILSAIGLLLLFPALATAKNVVRTDMPITLTVLQEGDFGNYWQASAAELQENFDSTIGFIQVKNISNSAVNTATFYADYRDAVGRRCFSLIYSLAENEAKAKDSLLKGETRKLYSVAAALMPSVKPITVHLFLVRQPSSALALASTTSMIEAPITFSLKNSPQGDQVSLPTEFPDMNGPIVDLALIAVTVDELGRVSNIESLDSLNEEVRAWSTKFISNQAFYPATVGWTPKIGTTLVLLRAVTESAQLAQSRGLSIRELPWVTRYIETLDTQPLPPVTQILFQRPPTKVKMGGSKEWIDLPATPVGIYEPYTPGSEWCPGVVKVVPDSSSPLHLRRELVQVGDGS
jgi:hypothetical protein